jgi:hypothetical protein
MYLMQPLIRSPFFKVNGKIIVAVRRSASFPVKLKYYKNIESNEF